MKPKVAALIILLWTTGSWIHAAELPDNFPETPRVKLCINTAWKFFSGDPDRFYYANETDDTAWNDISVPHTLKLTSIHLDGCKDDKYQRTFHRDVGGYRKSIDVTGHPRKKVFLD